MEAISDYFNLATTVIAVLVICGSAILKLWNPTSKVGNAAIKLFNFVSTVNPKSVIVVTKEQIATLEDLKNNWGHKTPDEVYNEVGHALGLK